MSNETKFYTQHQNNSGGIFDHDAKSGIGYAVCVEAFDHIHAKARLEHIINSYSESGDCPCCGPRWSFWLDDDDGETSPMLYNEPLRGQWGIPSYIHYLGGRIVGVDDPEAAASLAREQGK